MNSNSTWESQIGNHTDTDSVIDQRPLRPIRSSLLSST